MKKVINFLLIMVLTFILVGCGDNNQKDDPNQDQEPIKYTVQFYVEEKLYKTLKILENTTIGKDKVENPIKEGFEFVSWQDDTKTDVDLDTLKITKATKLYATFKEVITDDTLIVDAVKEDGKTYYLVVGWWETTKLNDDGTAKITSSLTKDTVRVFYANLKLYLKAYGATDEQIKNVQFRNYSTEGVAEMGTAINNDGDVDLLIGVGNNINSTAGVELFEGNDGKQKAKMGTQAIERYVALPNHESMNNVAISVFDWIKTETGQTAFLSQLEEKDITLAPTRTDDINVTVTVYGLSEDKEVTTLTSKKDQIAVPAISVEDGYKFLGYALAKDAEEAIILVAAGTALSYENIENLLNEAETLELYPVIVKEEVDTNYDLVVYIHVTSSSKISEAEVNLLKLRFEESLETTKNINYVLVKEGKAVDFQTKIEEDIKAGVTIDVVIGGNATTKNLSAIDDNYINATCGANHFADGSRKIIVLSTAASTHLDLAKEFYTFMTNEAPTLSLHVAYWVGKDNKWVKETEIETIKQGIETYLNQLFASENALTTYKLSITYYTAVKTKVAELSEETKAFNDGKGVGLIIGTGNNATDESNMGTAIIEQKDCPTSIVAGERKVSICNNNFIYQAIYDNYFIEPANE